MSIYSFFRRFDWFNWFRFRIWDRYHVLKLKYVNPGYHDSDEILIHSMFQVLCNFLELEQPDEIVNWDSDPEHKAARHEMDVLYNWWKDRQNRESKNPILQTDIKSPEMKFTPLEDKPGFSSMEFVHVSKEDEAKWEKACEDCEIWERKCFEEDTEMMTRLIKLRPFLWT